MLGNFAVVAMPFVTVQLGQCGNQLGTEFFRSLINDAFCTSSGCPQQVEEVYRESLVER